MSPTVLRRALPYGLLAVLAIAVREALVLRSGGFSASYGYDTGVYYAAADALIHGRIPYRDFILLHPPAVMLALTPSALLGHLTSDHVGFLTASQSFTALSGVNSALVAVAAVRWGLPRSAAFLGGGFYAVWFGAASAEFSCRLEPLGNFFLLAALCLLPATGGRSRRALVFAGVFLGLAVSTKIWFCVPVLVLLGWLAAKRRWRQLAAAGAGLLAAGLVVDAPFLVLSHGVMFDRVVLDQLDRPSIYRSPTLRLSIITALQRVDAAHLQLTLAAVLVLMAAVLLLATRRPAPRLFPLLAVAHLAVLLLSPSWFGFYADFAAVPLALSVAGAAGGAVRVGLGRAVSGVAVAGAAGTTAAILLLGTFNAARPWSHPASLIEAVRGDRCVMSDEPAGLIELDKLDSDLAHGCPNWIDVTGRTYFGADHRPGLRSANLVWQRDLLDYLQEGQAAFVLRWGGDGLTHADRRVLARGGVLEHSDGGTLYATDDESVAGQDGARNAQGSDAARRHHRVGEESGEDPDE